MRTKFILFCFLLFAGIASAQVKRVAILETVDKEGTITYANKLILRSNLSKAITNTPGYEAYDRTDIDAIMGEQDFQRTGMVSNDQIKKLGEMTGANYILVAEAVVIDASNMFITAKLLDVETAQTILTDNIMMATTPKAIQDGCVTLANKLFNTSNMKSSSVAKSTPAPKKEKEVAPEKPEVKETATLEANGPLIKRNSKTDQKLFGVSEYTYDGTQMDKKALQNFLKNNSPKAYKKYMAGQACIQTGWALLGVGIAATAAGTTLMLLPGSRVGNSDDDLFEGYNDDKNAPYDTGTGNYRTLGVGVLAAGCSMAGVSVPLLIGGYAVRDNAYKTYNVAPKQKNQLSLNLTGNSNGIGLALNF